VRPVNVERAKSNLVALMVTIEDAETHLLETSRRERELASIYATEGAVDETALQNKYSGLKS